MATVQDQMRRLNVAREKVREIDGKRNRLAGLVEERTKTVEQLEKQARDEFDCEIDELPEMIIQFKKEAEEGIAQAESILGIDNEDEDTDATPADDDEDALFG